MMAIREPFEYELAPRRMDKGTRWVTVTLTNRSSAALRALDVKLNSLDVYSIDVVTEGSFIPVLDPGG